MIVSRKTLPFAISFSANRSICEVFSDRIEMKVNKQTEFYVGQPK